MTMRSRENCIILFVKYPHPGQVKTRLAKDIGNKKAAELYKCFVADILEMLENIPCDKCIYITPPSDKDAFKAWLGSQHTLLAQRGDDLGEKMEDAFIDCFAKNYKRAIIIGTDSPDIDASLINDALAKLSDADAVIGPALDGGYYLLGFTRAGFVPHVFTHIPWSTDQVFNETLTILRRKEKTIHILKEWHDIDTLNDLKRLTKQHSPRFLNSHTYNYLFDILFNRTR